MISYEFTIQEIIAILMDPYHVTNEFLFWIKYKHYPILRWTQKGPFYLFQHFNTTSYSKWLIPLKLIYFVKHDISRNKSTILTRGSPVLNYTAQADWTIVDIQQAGKYVPQNYLYTWCQALIFEYR